jgi:hypothetical protein
MSVFKYCLPLAAMFALGTPTLAASTCADHESLVKLLSNRYKEALSSYGVSGQKNIVEVFVSKTGTFTILATRTDGVSCVVATGDNWENELKNLTSL